MTREWYKENKHILEAWAEGKEVEFRLANTNNKWESLNENTEWLYYFEYRIKPEKEFPIYAKRKGYNIWVKFISEETYEVIGMKPPTKIAEVYGTYVGEIVEHGHPYTNDEIWEIIPNPYELRDKDPIWCWEDFAISMRCIKFWDDKNKVPYTYKGKRNGMKCDNYKKVLPWDEPNWVKEARKHLED